LTNLQGKTALVTGASRGIGAAIAKSLAQSGVHLGLASRSGDDLGIENCIAMNTDVRDPALLEELATATAERFGGIDILVINAGVGSYGPFLDVPEDELEDMIDVNVKGAIYSVRAVLPHLLQADGGGDIVMIASEAGRRGLPLEAVYCASKFAQIGLMRALDHELRESNVRCSTVAPGGVATDFAMGRGRYEGMSELAGMMSAEDVAEAVSYVLTRPRNHRILEVAFRPMTEGSMG
jgi:3-oxoacyl-[acyl-carrier protein] reductase